MRLKLLAAVAMFGCVGLLDRPGGAVSAASAAEPPNAHVWQGQTRSVSVFKNGMGFFVRQAEVTLRDGWAVAKEIPPAKFGTLAVYAARDNELVDMVGSGPGELIEFDGRDATNDDETKRARLTAALKLNVQLTYTHQDAERTAAGKLVSVGPEFVVLEGSANNFAVAVAQITKLQLLELPLRVHVAGDDGQSIARTQIGMAYLREGITWIPEYSLRVLDDHTAQLTLRGTLVNEAEDLVKCDVNFVVGVPHFAHTGYMAPIAVGQVLRALGSSVAPPEVRTQIANRAALSNNGNMASQFGQGSGGGVIERAVGEESGRLSSTLGNLPRIDAAAGTDYTVYTKKGLTVRRGERAIVTLFVKKINYSHVYRWTPPGAMQHSLVLANDTDTAWTTGPCLAVSEEQPLSEDMLAYTPRGGRAEIPLTTSVNIAHEKSESEIDRKLKAHQPSNDVFFDLVTIGGKLKLKNFEPRDVEVVIADAAMPGKPISASDNGALAADSSKLKLTERAGTVSWTLRLKPGEQKVLEYRYERYVPSQ